MAIVPSEYSTKSCKCEMRETPAAENITTQQPTVMLFL
jgi:hypothetical protein